MPTASNLTVALVSAFFPPVFGGVPTVLGILLDEYLNNGVNVVVVSPTPKRKNPRYRDVRWMKMNRVLAA